MYQPNAAVRSLAPVAAPLSLLSHFHFTYLLFKTRSRYPGNCIRVPSS